MTKEEVVKHRALLENLKVKAYKGDDSGEKEDIKVPIWVVCDNSLNILDNGLNTVWDDKNERIVHFRYNTPGTFYGSANSSLTAGNKPVFSLCIIVVDYGEIQNMRVEANQEVLDQIAEILGDSLTEEMKNFIQYKYIDSLDAKVSINKKKEIDFRTQRNKNSIESKQNHTEDDEYKTTVQPVSFF